MDTSSVQNGRVWIDRGAESVWLRVEAAVSLGEFYVVSGWCSAGGEVRLWTSGKEVRFNKSTRARGDVAKALDLRTEENLGFVLVGKGVSASSTSIGFADVDGQMYPIQFQTPSASLSLSAILPSSELVRISRFVPLYSDAWKHLLAAAAGRVGRESEAVGRIEFAASSSQDGGALASGWCLTSPKCEAVWVETDRGKFFPMSDAVPRHRQDVVDAYPDKFTPGDRGPGFALHAVETSPGDVLRLRALLGSEVLELSQKVVDNLPSDPRRVAELAFGFSPTSASKFSEYVRRVAFGPVDEAIRRNLENSKDFETRVEEFGLGIEVPRASIIVPVYGRADLIEHQLIEFSRDPWLKENAELVYVIDDPILVDRVLTDSGILADLYNLAFKVVWDGKNHGFSGANNLGAKVARGRDLVFMNSDVIPNSPGWLQVLLERLHVSDSIGVVAPRLLFADGSIQHAGMTFRRRTDLGIWTNHHPNMGLDPKLDPAGVEDCVVPAVTGACMALRTRDFLAVEGWDEGYLIGDFEDSDLCLKLRALGKSIVYSPSVELTHLERQSFSMLGDGGFRQKVVIYNAYRHYSRWSSVIEEVSNAA